MPVRDWLLAGLVLILAQIPVTPPGSWEKVGIVTMLVTGLSAFYFQWVVPGKRLKDKETECIELRAALDVERETHTKDLLDMKMIAEALVRAREQDKGR